MATTYGTITPITCTIASLAAAGARSSAAVTTSTSVNVIDYRIIVKISNNTTTAPTGMKAVFIWVKTSEDGGTTWTGNASGSVDAAITLDQPHQFVLGCVIPFSASNVTRVGSFSLKAACGGSIPAMWGIIVENQTGSTLNATSTTHSVQYRLESV